MNGRNLAAVPKNCSYLSHDHALKFIVFHENPNLVGGLEHVFPHSVENFIIPTDFHSIIVRGRLNHHHARWCPPIFLSCFIIPLTIEISTISPSEIRVMFTNLAIDRGHIMGVP